MVGNIRVSIIGTRVDKDNDIASHVIYNESLDNMINFIKKYDLHILRDLDPVSVMVTYIDKDMEMKSHIIEPIYRGSSIMWNMHNADRHKKLELLFNELDAEDYDMICDIIRYIYASDAEWFINRVINKIYDKDGNIKYDMAEETISILKLLCKYSRI